MTLPDIGQVVSTQYTAEGLRDLKRIMDRFTCTFGQALSRAVGCLGLIVSYLPAGSKNRLLIESSDPDAEGDEYMIRDVKTGEERRVKLYPITLENWEKARLH